jgi:hypothetical protein
MLLVSSLPPQSHRCRSHLAVDVDSHSTAVDSSCCLRSAQFASPLSQAAPVLAIDDIVDPHNHADAVVAHCPCVSLTVDGVASPVLSPVTDLL